MLKRMVWLSGLLLLLAVMFFTVESVYSSQERASILSKKDTRLSDFHYAQTIAEKVESLIPMDGSDYHSLYQQFKPITSDSVFNEYFPTSSYEGGAKSVSVVQNSVEGELEGNHNYLFKLNLTLVNGSTQQNLVMLVTVNNGIITKIQSLG